MDQAAIPVTTDEAEAFAVARHLGAATPLLRTVLDEEAAFWHPEPPPPTGLLGLMGQAFSGGFRDLAADERAQVAGIVEGAIRSGPEYVRTAVVTGFLEGAIHQAEADGTWFDVAAVLGQLSREFADKYRDDPFFGTVAAQNGPTPA